MSKPITVKSGEWLSVIESIDRVSDDIATIEIYGQDISVNEAKKIIRHFVKMRDFRMYLAALRITEK